MAKKNSAKSESNRNAERTQHEEMRYPFRRTRTVLLLSVASALILTLAFPPANLSFLAYVGLVPLLVAIVLARTTRLAVLAAFLAGVIFFAINCYWLFLVTFLGGIPLVIYLAAYFAVFALALRYIIALTRWPMTILAPVLWVSLEYIRSILLTGFPWLYLGHTQYANTALIQIADVGGAYIVSFLVVMTSGIIVDVMTRPLFVRYSQHIKFSRSIFVMTLIVIAAWLGTVIYGTYRLSENTTRPGPTIAVVQGNVPQEIKRRAKHEDIIEDEEFILNQHVELTNQVIASEKDVGLIIWPETMVPGEINSEFLKADLDALIRDRRCIPQLREEQMRYRSYWHKIHQFAREANANLLVGVPTRNFTGAYVNPDNFIIVEGDRYNSALLIKPDTAEFTSAHRYDKSHLVLFGEYVPFRGWPTVYDLLQSLTPYPYDYSLTPGRPDQEPFEQDGIRYAVAICYEGAMPMRIREMSTRAGKKQVDFLVNISNDGWFINPDWWPQWIPSTELDQHLNLYAFRAVENRLGIVRAVNTGISAFITPDGVIKKMVRLPDGSRHNVRGRLTGNVLLDSRVTLYARFGDVFARLCFLTALFLAGFCIISVVKNRKMRKVKK